MDVAGATAIIPPVTEREYITWNVRQARMLLNEAWGLLAQRPAIVPPPEHLDRAVAAAHNAAEHLYDVGQVDEPHEAVREALAAAAAVMEATRELRDGMRPIVDARAQVAEQLATVDTTLARLLERLHQ